MLIDKYATHIPILAAIFRICRIESVFEFGPGSYSTKFFELNAKRTISVELSSKEWYEKVKNLVSQEKVKLSFIPDMYKAIDFFLSETSKIDLVFVDGSAESRVKCIEAAFGRTNVIITHDSETAGHIGDFYNWNEIKMNKEYWWIDVTKFCPWTAVITNAENIIKELSFVFQEIEIKIRGQKH